MWNVGLEKKKNDTSVICGQGETIRRCQPVGGWKMKKEVKGLNMNEVFHTHV
jgi:hypothetical protein